MVLPFDRTRFRATSVVDRPGDWGPLYDVTVRAVDDEGHLTELTYDGETAYTAANVVMLDHAEAVARSARVPLVAVVAWDGTPRPGTDVTALFRDDARRRGLDVIELSTR